VEARLANALSQNGGVLATAREARDMLCDWRGPTCPGEKFPEKDRPYNLASPGKRTGDGRASDGFVRAMKGGNALGAKGPC